MANQDISFYKYLEAAFRYRLFNPKGVVATPDTRFNYLSYNLPFNRIFYYARRVLPKFYTSEFPDTEEGNLQMAKKVLEKLDRHQDPELDRYFDPATAPTGYEQLITEAQAASQQATAEQTASMQSTPSPGGIGLPSAPSISVTPRRVFIVQQPAPPSGGMEGGPGQGIAATNKADMLEAKRVGPATAKSNRLEAETNRLNAQAATFQTKAPSEVSLSSTSTPPRFNFSAFKSSLSSNFKKVQNFASRANPFIKTNLGRIGRGISGAARSGLETANPFLGRMGNGLVNGLTSIANPRGIGGVGSRSILGKVGGFGRGGGSGGISSISKFGKSRGKWALILLLLGFMLLTGILAITGINQTGTIPPIAPGGSDISSCKFTRAGNSQLVKSTILQGWITSAATTTGIPPQILASVAMHESQNFVANADNNHDAIKTGLYCNPGKVFCEKNGQVLHSISGQDDPCTANEIANGAKTAQAVGLMQALDIYNPGKNLCSITESLSIAAAKLKADGITSQPTQDQVNTAINRYYNSCTYGSYSYCNEVWQDLQSCKPTTPSAIASCPVPGGHISTPSYNANPKTGHCGSSYGYACHCETIGRRAKAVDVPTNGQSVVLPTINGQPATWKLIVGPYTVDSEEGGGFGYTFQAASGNDTWYLDMLHLNRSSLALGKEYPSGTPIATTVIDHVHMTIGKNLSNIPMAGSPTDCDPNWLPSDFMCQ